MKAPMIRVIHPKWKHRLMECRTELKAIEMTLQRWGITKEVLELGVNPVVRDLVEKRELLKSRITTYLWQHSVCAVVRCTPTRIFFGKLGSAPVDHKERYASRLRIARLVGELRGEFFWKDQDHAEKILAFHKAQTKKGGKRKCSR